MSTTLTPAVRVAVARSLASAFDAHCEIMRLDVPLKRAAEALEEFKRVLIDELGLSEETTMYCTACSGLILEKDPCHFCSDDALLCEDCAPTYAEVIAQKRESLRETSDPEEKFSFARQIRRLVEEARKHGRNTKMLSVF
jgi:hypothetical protein